MSEEKSVVAYRARDGQTIKLSPSIIKNFLVSGYPDLVTNQELYMYMGVCKSRGLNPFIKDCYLIKYNSKDNAAIIVSIDYYRKRARAQQDCQGWKTGIVVLNRNAEIEQREGCILLEGEELVGGWFEALPRGFVTPIRKFIPLARYIKHTRDGKITAFWSADNQPEQIAKVAESQGLRATWPDEFQGLYTDAERESMEAQAGFDAGITSAADDEKRREDLARAAEKSTETVDEGQKPKVPPPEKQTPDNKGKQPQTEEQSLRSSDLYLNFDPYQEDVGTRYHRAKILKITDLLTQEDVEFADSWPGARLHQALKDASKNPEQTEDPGESGQTEEPGEEETPDDPEVLLGLQSDIARTKASEPELYRHAYINQLQKEVVRPGVKTSEMTIAECEALLQDVAEQKQMRDRL